MTQTAMPCKPSRMAGPALVVLACLLLAACGTTGGKAGKGGDVPGASHGHSEGGGYYQDDGPPRGHRGPDPDSVADAVPRDEPLARTGNKPYTALGKRYTPMASANGYRQVGHASWYGRKYHGNRTSSGETYDMFSMTAAHPVLPLPTYVEVRNLANNRKVVVKVNDRGPFLNNRIIDLSYMAAQKLDIVRTGTGRVEVRAVFAGDVPEPSRTRNLAGAEAPAVPAAPVATVATVATAVPAAASPTAPNPVARVAASAANTVIQPAQAAPATASYVLQAGSFASRGNAERLAIRLRQGGYDNVRILPVQVSGRHYHRVQVGPYHSRESADLAGETVREYLGAPVSVLGVGSG